MFDEPVIEISTREVTATTPDTTIAKAIGIMEKNNFHNLVVLDSDKIYLVNIQDLLVASNPESNVDGVMFKPHCIHKDTPTIDAISELLDSGQRAAPVVDDDGKLEGIITDYDIMRRGAESLILKDAKVTEIMTKNPICVEETDSIGKARTIMRKNNIGRVLVVDANNKLKGIVTGGDILKKIYKPKRRMTVGEVKGENIPRMGQPVSLISSSPVRTADVDANLAEIANLMQKYDIRSVPILSDGVPRGIVTIPDIMKYLKGLKEETKVEVEIQGTPDEEYKELAERVIETEVRKIVKIAKRVHWIKIVIKKERDRGGTSYYKIGAHVKTPDKLYVAQSEPGGIHSQTMIAKRGAENREVEVRAGKRRWDFIDVLKDALLSVEGQIEEDKEKRLKNGRFF
ncbi:MAG: CBS domain-containing protein [Methanophagales archaeon]|nr:CBS domain-containing protein [Methanophagales archaeon]MCW3140731.1 CBS domain-containing protein [Methanophagales archaeon]